LRYRGSSPHRPETAMSWTKPLAATLAVAGILAVALLDYATGIELHVYPLYLLPVAIAAWSLSRGGWLLAVLLATLAWTVVEVLGGARAARLVWVLNVLAQASIFFVVA